MNRTFSIIGFLAVLMVSVLSAGPSLAGCDLYQGDTAIYTGAATHNMPNVLLIIDNSRDTLNTASGQSYNHTHNYLAECQAAVGAANCYDTFGIYQAGQQGTFTHTALNSPSSASSLLNTATVQGSLPDLSAAAVTSCTSNNPVPDSVKAALLGVVGSQTTGGTYQGSATGSNPNLKLKSGQVVCDTTGQGATYALGNFLNYSLVPPPPIMVTGSTGSVYKLTASHISSCPSTTNPDDAPITGAAWSSYWSLYTGAVSTISPPPAWAPCTPYDLGSDTQQKLIYDALNTVVSGARFAVKFGAMVYGSNNSGGRLIDPIKDLSADADFTAFMNTLPKASGDTLNSNTARPQAEALLNAYEYFEGFSGPQEFATGSFSPAFTSRYCEKLFVILLTNGLPNGESKTGLASAIGDYDADGREPNATASAYGQGTHYLDDVAKKMYVNGVFAYDATGSTVIQRIRTNVILAFQADDPLLASTANDSHGHGSYMVVNNAQQLAVALNAILSSIMLEADTSFVAPVVPVSPQSKVYTGSRVYMGFFKPKASQYWYGNIKKYSVDVDGNILDMLGHYANYVDQDFNYFDDRDNALMPQGTQNGSFRATTRSFWSSAADAGAVDAGGAGGMLLARGDSISCTTCDTTGAARNIYTYLGSSANLAADSNKFRTQNTSLVGAATATTLFALGSSSTTDDVKKLINFVSGFDVYDEDGDGISIEKRAWIFGDVLHSKPFVISYASSVVSGYRFSKVR